MQCSAVQRVVASCKAPCSWPGDSSWPPETKIPSQLSLRSGDGSMSVSGSDCDCENMTSSLREQKISEFFRSVFLRHASSEGVVSLDSLGPALASLGRSVPTERLARIRRKLDKDGTGVISLKDPEFILTVASLNVTDVGAIKDDVLTSAFKIFDMVRIKTTV